MAERITKASIVLLNLNLNNIYEGVGVGVSR
jgi:hypothetical protein